jgi:hypothetical protein
MTGIAERAERGARNRNCVVSLHRDTITIGGSSIAVSRTFVIVANR